MHEFLVNSQDPETSEKYDLRPAVGIAAIQLGIPKRMTAIHVLDFDEDGNVIGADDYALVNPKIISHTEKQSYLKDGEGCLSVNDEVQGYVPRYAKVTVKGYDIDQEELQKEFKTVEWDAKAAEKEGFEHFMLKEIYEQPKAVADTISPRIKNGKIVIDELEMTDEDIKKVSRIQMVACS